MAFNDDVPVATNTIAADLVAINANWEYVIHGDGTSGRVLRAIRVKIDDGTNASTLKGTITSLFNGDTKAETDNIAKGATTSTIWTLDADGKVLTLEAAGLSGNVVGILSVNIHGNLSTTNLNVESNVVSNDIALAVQDADVGTNTDQTVLVDTGLYYIDVTYITDA